MNITTVEIDDTLLAKLEETRLDAAIATRFKERMRDVGSRATHRVLLDLSDVQFMDSSGLGAVIAVRKSLPEGRRIEIAGLTPNVARVFRLTKMDTVFTLYDNVDAALPPEAPA